MSDTAPVSTPGVQETIVERYPDGALVQEQWVRVSQTILDGDTAALYAIEQDVAEFIRDEITVQVTVAPLTLSINIAPEGAPPDIREYSVPPPTVTATATVRDGGDKRLSFTILQHLKTVGLTPQGRGA